MEIHSRFRLKKPHAWLLSFHFLFRYGTTGGAPSNLDCVPCELTQISKALNDGTSGHPYPFYLKKANQLFTSLTLNTSIHLTRFYKQIIFRPPLSPLNYLFLFAPIDVVKLIFHEDVLHKLNPPPNMFCLLLHCSRRALCDDTSVSNNVLAQPMIFQ